MKGKQEVLVSSNCCITVFYRVNLTHCDILLKGEDESKPRCSQICRKLQLRCFLKEGHQGRHKYTPKGLLSPSTITKLLLELTSGEIISHAGLDNIDVIKGHENFERMSQLAGNLCSIIDTVEAKEKAEVLKKEISTSETFHKTKFISHLDIGSSQCMCVECGKRR